jgi:hypothetical protein
VKRVLATVTPASGWNLMTSVALLCSIGNWHETKFDRLVPAAGLPEPGLCQTAQARPAFYMNLISLAKRCTIVDRMPQARSRDMRLTRDAIFEIRRRAEAAKRTVQPY